jgi:hypothetical protein
LYVLISNKIWQNSTSKSHSYPTPPICNLHSQGEQQSNHLPVNMGGTKLGKNTAKNMSLQTTCQQTTANTDAKKCLCQEDN